MITTCSMQCRTHGKSTDRRPAGVAGQPHPLAGAGDLHHCHGRVAGHRRTADTRGGTAVCRLGAGRRGQSGTTGNPGLGLCRRSLRGSAELRHGPLVSSGHPANAVIRPPPPLADAGRKLLPGIRHLQHSAGSFHRANQTHHPHDRRHVRHALLAFSSGQHTVRRRLGTCVCLAWLCGRQRHTLAGTRIILEPGTAAGRRAGRVRLCASSDTAYAETLEQPGRRRPLPLHADIDGTRQAVV